MKKILLLTGLILAFVACTRQDDALPEQLVQTKEITIKATREGLATKTELHSGSDVYWCPGDSLSLFFRNGDNGGSKFKAQNTEAVPIAEFKGTIDVVSGGGESSGGEYWFWGIYPYSTQNSCDGSSITTVIPHEQVGKAGTFASNTFITMARAKGLNLAFYNICTGVKFNLSRTDIKAVTFRGNKNEHIAGKVNVGWNDSGKPAIQSYVSGRKVITVTAPEGGTFASGTDYYIIFAPTLFEEGFTMTVITNDSKQGVFYYNNSREFKRSIFVNISNLNERVNAWADVGDAAVKEVTDEGGTIEVNIDSDVECHALIPEDAQSWISVATKTKSTQQTIGLVVQPNTGESRSATIIIHSVDGTIVLPYVIEQTTNHNYVLTTEREALISIYNALDGDNWKDGYNNNWLSDKPVGEWYGVEVDEDGFVTSLYLTAYGEIPSDLKALSHLKKLVTNYYSSNKNLEIPKIIFSLTQLEYLHLYGQFLNGTISSEIGNLTNLKHLEINDTKISGQIPESISQLTQLEYLDLQLNQLSGELPASMGNLTKLRHIMLRGNQFSGNIPESVQALPIWKYDWGRIISENYFNERTMNIPAPEISGITTDGELINIPNEQHSYSVLIQWSAQYDGYLISQIDALNQIFNKYSDNVSFVGLVCSHREQGLSSVKNYIQNHNIQWPSIYWESGTEVIKGQEEAVDGISRQEYAAPCFPAIFVFHNDKVVYWDLNVYGGVSLLDDYLSINVLGEQPDYYVSTDYSKDGQVITKQTASVGAGIDLILMGDAYSDRQIQDGTYAEVLDKVVESFFSVEPYSSFKDFFNIYYVNVVSATEGYEHDGQALNTFFGSGTFVGGNNGKCIDYALNAISEQRMDDALIIVAMNKDTYAGTCHMTPGTSGDYGSGLSIVYFPVSSDTETFNGMVSHEAGGHGFAKLADEYAYEYMGAIPSEEIANRKTMEPYGWWKNVDFTNVPAQVKWSSFISDNRYANEHIGCYEGGLTYWTGVWRPTENSIMRYNVGGFNAPSRYAIWYRIGKLAYGSNWNGTYEDFVTYDAVNISASAIASNAAQVKKLKKPLPPLHAPVVRGYNWRDMKKMEQKKDERNKK